MNNVKALPAKKAWEAPVVLEVAAAQETASGNTRSIGDSNSNQHTS